MLKTLFCALVFLIHANHSFAVTVKNEVIYGSDDRQLVNSKMDKRYLEMIKKIAPAIAVLVDSSDLKKGKLLDGELGKESIQQVIVPSIAREKNLCEKEKFRDLPAFGSCTGFLVGDDLLLTAGHCIKGPLACQKKKWVFDYRQEQTVILDYEFEKSTLFSQGKSKTKKESAPKNNRYYKLQFPTSSIVGCQEIIRRVDDSENKVDFALIRLDRKMTGREPLKYRLKGSISDNDRVMVVGHPWGMPLTLAPVGTIRGNNKENYFFTTNTDTFAGNSGSPVFNAETLEVEGVLVRGESDVRNLRHGEGAGTFFCKELKTCQENECDGEDATRISAIPDLVLAPEVLKVLRLSESFTKDQVDNADTPSALPQCLPNDVSETDVQVIPPLNSGPNVSTDELDEAPSKTIPSPV